MAPKKTTPTPKRRRGAARAPVSQQRLNDAEARLRMLQDLSSDWYWEQDENLRFTMLTRKTEAEARFAASDSIGKQRWELPYLDVTEEQWEAHKALLHARQPFYDFVLKRRDRAGEVRYSCVSGIPFHDRDGNFKGYRGIGRDITERIQAETREAMAHAIARLLAEEATVAEVMPKIIESICSIIDWQYGAYWTIDRKERVVRCSEIWCAPAFAEIEFVKFTRDTASFALERKYENSTRPRGVVQYVAATGEPAWYEDITVHKDAQRSGLAVKGGLRSAFAFPITVNDETFGIMEFFSHETRKPDPELMKMTLTIGSQIGQFCRRKGAEAALRDANHALQAVVQTSPLAIYTYDLDGYVTLWNPAAERIYGWKEAEVLGRFLPVVQNEKVEEFRTFREQIRQGQTFTNAEFVRQKRDGTRIDISVSTAALYDADGRPVGIMAITADITERKRAEARQAMEHAITRLMVDPDTMDDIIPKIIRAICESLGWDYGAYWGLQRENEALCRIQAWNVPAIDATDFVKQSESEVLHIQSTASPSLGGVIRRAWLSGRPIWTVDVTRDPTFRRAPFAKQIGFHTAVAFPVTSAGETRGVMEFYTRDTSHPDDHLVQALQKIGGQIGQFIERQNADVRQEMEHAVTRLLAESDSPSEVVPEVIQTICKTLRWDYGGYWAFDDKNQTLQCKEIWCPPPLENTDFIKHCRRRVLPLGSGGLVGRTWIEDKPIWITDVTVEPGFGRARMAKAANLRSGFAFPIVIGNSNIGVMEFFASSYRQPDELLLKSTQAIGSQIGQFCQRKQAEQDLVFVATHDPLTLLPNREMFNERLNHALAQARRHDTKLVIFFIDLDRFKNINDTLGHDAGDRLLKEMARRLSGCLRESDTVARQGGDEFIILIEELEEPQHAAQVAAKILSVISTPVLLGGQEYQVTASIGISTFPDDGQDGAALLKNADSAMYRAKDLGKNNYQFYSAQMNLHSLERLEMEARLRRAYERNEFLLHYQPKVDIRSGRVNGVEALLRWHHPEKGLVPPGQFIPLAEETGLIVPIGRWVLRTACAQVSTWQKQGLPPVRVAVNLSPRQFSDDNLLHDIETALSLSGLDPRLLEVEITESMVMRDPEEAIKILSALTAMGLRVAIDDFGTGYSSLSALKRFPIDDLKIDRSFIKDIPLDGDDVAITRAIIALAHSLRLSVIAEGVETAEQLDFLRQNGCDNIQGFYFSKPLPEKEIVEFLRNNHHGEYPPSSQAAS